MDIVITDIESQVVYLFVYSCLLFTVMLLLLLFIVSYWCISGIDDGIIGRILCTTVQVPL